MSEQQLLPLTESDVNSLKEIATQVLQHAEHCGVTAAEVGASLQTGLSTTVRMGEVETIAFNRDKGVTVTVYFQQSKGSASTSDTRSQSLKATVKAACDIAKYTAADEYAGLAEKQLLAKEFPDLQLHFPWSLSPEEAIAIAKKCEDVARADERIINSEGASLSTAQSAGVYGNSHGFLQGQLGSRHSLSCVLIAAAEEKMQRDYWYTLARDPKEMQSAVEVANSAIERTVRRLGAQKLATAKMPVLFSAEMASGLLSAFVAAISGGNLYRQASFLLDSLGQAIFNPIIRLHEQPHLPKGLGSCAFDAEGVATQARDIVTAGELQSYVLGSYAARKLGMQTTANAGGVHNLTLEPGEDDLAALLRTMGTGLYVTELMGQGVNIVTGDYSRGAAGFWVENGQICYPVEEITIAGNLQEMFKNMCAVGNDVDYRGNIITSSILIAEMMVAGQ